jgi:hypothetical protein
MQRKLTTPQLAALQADLEAIDEARQAPVWGINGHAGF